MSARKFFALGILGVALGLPGCASFDVDRALDQTNREAASFTNGQLKLIADESQRQQANAYAQTLLAKPLEQNAAVELAIANSPAIQVLIAQNWACAANAAQGGRIANPVFTFERFKYVNELELGRLLAFGLLDVLTLPRRNSMAQMRLAQVQTQMTIDTIEQVTQVRQAWIHAVAAEQVLTYAKQVNDIAQASAELARRMQSVGNFNKLQRARQQVFYADAATELANASHAATAARETLVRALGLTDNQASLLQIPNRLPELPDQPQSGAEVGALASKDRLDISLAKHAFNADAKEQGFANVMSLTDIELAIRKDTLFDAGSKNNRSGFELSVRLPVLDWGAMRRDAMSAQLLASANQLEAVTRAAGSHLRESYSSYRTAYDIAKHYRDEIVPLRKIIADENVLRYNGMIIGVFELLADARDQVTSVIAAIGAQRQFWLADAALQASIVGKPVFSPVGMGSVNKAAIAPAH
jgi:outer membrane protein TolC